MTKLEISDEAVVTAIQDLITLVGDTQNTLETDLVTQLIQTSLKLYVDKHDTGQLKLMTRALKEMRYAYRIFNQYIGSKRISIFGSARTPETHQDYITAKAFSNLMAQQGWMCITGAANGIMKAAVEGSEKGASFGLSIKLPFEIPTNVVIAGDPKLIIFRYFFTRKLMFLSHSDAVAVFPGGFGTMDEIFEVITLMQTGKTTTLPLVLLEGNGGYWDHWEEYIKEQLLSKGWISQEDLYLYYKAPSIQKGVEHIQQFYKRYHSQRYVKDYLVIRMKEALTPSQVSRLNQQFSTALIKSGEIIQSPPLPEETDFLDLPRLIFVHNRQNYGSLRALIDQINNF